MKQSPLLEFTSTGFEVTPGEDDATHPGLYGKALAEWVREQVCDRGREAGAVIAEDFGWCVPVEDSTHGLYVVCTSTDPDCRRWGVFAFAEGGLLARVLGKDRRAERIAELFLIVKDSLQSRADVLDLRQSMG